MDATVESLGIDRLLVEEIWHRIAAESSWEDVKTRLQK